MTDQVIFKMTPKDSDFEPECIAFILSEPAMTDHVLSYMHIGQHSEASVDFIDDCTPATEEESASLKAELKAIGYDL